MQPSDEDSPSWEGDSSDEGGQGSVAEESGLGETAESPWTPPQFSLRSMLIGVTAFCLACAVTSGFGLDWFEGFVGLGMVGLLYWFVVGCLRLIRVGMAAR